MTIVEFLTARLGEAEERATYAQTVISGDWDDWEPIAHQLPADCRSVPNVDRLDQHLQYNADPAHVLREVKAKRDLIEYWQFSADEFAQDENDEAAGAAWATMNNVLVTLAGAHRTHPDYAGDDVDDWTWPDDEVRRTDTT